MLKFGDFRSLLGPLPHTYYSWYNGYFYQSLNSHNSYNFDLEQKFIRMFYVQISCALYNMMYSLSAKTQKLQKITQLENFVNVRNLKWDVGTSYRAAIWSKYSLWCFRGIKWKKFRDYAFWNSFFRQIRDTLTYIHDEIFTFREFRSGLGFFWAKIRNDCAKRGKFESKFAPTSHTSPYSFFSSSRDVFSKYVSARINITNFVSKL